VEGDPLHGSIVLAAGFEYHEDADSATELPPETQVRLVMAERIPDEAVVIRGGRNLPADLRRGTTTHPSGVTGASVECTEGLTVEELAAAISHGQIGMTTAGAVRAAGGDVVRTSGRSPHHATLVGLSPDEASRLLTPTIPNPARKP
jgi:hypothetical protein